MNKKAIRERNEKWRKDREVARAKFQDDSAVDYEERLVWATDPLDPKDYDPGHAFLLRIFKRAECAACRIGPDHHAAKVLEQDSFICAPCCRARIKRKRDNLKATIGRRNG